MDKRTVIGILLILAILILTPIYQRWVMRTTIKQTPQETTIPQKEKPSSVDTTEKVVRKAAPPETLATAIESPETTTLPNIPEKIITVITDKFVVKISTKGGDIRSIRLRDIRDAHGKEVELAPGVIGDKNSELFIISGDRRISLSSIRFTSDVETLVINEDNPKDAVTLIGSIGNNVMVQRRFEFVRGMYHINASLFIAMQDTTHTIEDVEFWWTAGILPTEKNVGWDIREIAARYRIGKEAGKYKPSRKNPIFSLEGLADWIGITSKYFTVTLASSKEFGSQAVLAKSYWITDTAIYKREIPQVSVGLRNHVASPRVTLSYIIYAGPRDYFVLKNYGRNMTALVDLGWRWLAPITKVLMQIFRIIYAIVRSYGWAIIVFTVLMKIVLLPLAQKQLKSMRKMHEIQPVIKSITEQYRDDPQKMNIELMKVYKKHGVSPTSGCFPLIIQMPIFFALYKTLTNGFQFRAQRFFWVPDLAQADPYIIWPIVMTVTMFIQQLISTTDPKQKTMAYIMPLVFFFVFYKLPAGLVIYWTVFNILSIIHMIWVEKHWKSLPPEESTAS